MFFMYRYRNKRFAGLTPGLLTVGQDAESTMIALSIGLQS